MTANFLYLSQVEFHVHTCMMMFCVRLYYMYTADMLGNYLNN